MHHAVEPQNLERPLEADAADILVSTVRLLPFSSDADAVGLVTRCRFSAESCSTDPDPVGMIEMLRTLPASATSTNLLIPASSRICSYKEKGGSGVPAPRVGTMSGLVQDVRT